MAHPRRRPDPRLTLLLLFGGTTAALQASHAAALRHATPSSTHANHAAPMITPMRSRTPRAIQQNAEQDQFFLPLSVRRWVYNTLEPLDKGDFRWEFLVPFNNKTLSTSDKFIVCSAFIGLSFTVQTIADPGASVGVHLSYIAQFFSYAIGDPIGFRLLAVLTSILEIIGNLFEEKENGFIVSGVSSIPSLWDALRDTNDEDLFPVFYDQLFIVINGYYILRWVRRAREMPLPLHQLPRSPTLVTIGSPPPHPQVLNRDQIAFAVEWSPEEQSLFTNCFAPLGFRRAQFTRLLRSAQFETAGGDNPGLLTVQGEPIYDLIVPISGDGLEVRVDGVATAELPAFQLVGEASLLENLQSPGGKLHPPSRATIIAASGTRYVKWPQAAFYELQEEEDSDFAYSIQLMIARQLSDKLNEARKSQRDMREAYTAKIEADLKDKVKQQVQARLLAASPLFTPPRAGAATAVNTAPPSTRLETSSAGGAQTESERISLKNTELLTKDAASEKATAATEVRALLERSTRYERRIVALEADLEKRNSEFDSLKSVNLGSGILVLLGLFGLFDRIAGFENLPRLAVIQQYTDGVPPLL